MALLTTHASNLDLSAEPSERRWTREEYFQLAEQGYFRGQRVQLIDGRIIQMPPQGVPHALAIERADSALRAAFKSGYRFCIQMPFHAANGADPEPDIAVVVGSPRDPISDHPNTAVLIVEVSDTSLKLDRAKASLYAASGVGEYWIINLPEGGLEVHRDADVSGAVYRNVSISKRGESVTPLSAPHVAIAVNDLLP
jgi:Uma2 family endonuclease